MGCNVYKLKSVIYKSKVAIIQISNISTKTDKVYKQIEDLFVTKRMPPNPST